MFKQNRKIIGPLLLLILLMLTACGQEKKVANPTGEQDAKEAETKTVQTTKGDIVIPANPERIVAEEYIASLLVLDVKPIGAPGLALENYYVKDALKDVEDIGVYGKPSIERILGLKPDLIITGNGENYDALSKIAPTVVIPYGELKNAHEELTYFGELLGKEQEAKDWLSQYDQKIADAKAQVDAIIPEDASFSIIEDAGKSIYVYGDNFGRGGQPIYQSLGRKPPANIADEIMEKQWAEISEEVLAYYAGDYIILTSDDRTVEDFKKDPIWGNLPAVKNDHLYVWPEERSWYYDPTAVLAQVEELTNWLTNKK
ncbi:ABC transporter substrate-binding protein [Lysinibacillus fusiformis]|uniref:ABC transporter substrate-binding protein n=1 Tax=Lysinibacillus fusiformis TaxID=28031 RepID=UPI00215B4611|nr:ABC transporter substrate-binding protein [Lysinibacillus fusiformis]MCR8855110.1 ABC transporter substrate-binding protein [Lysinibacillus fusiformis]WKT76458.1 ABC transporter substrate-binding protein [Lysinibacillus fusiformis]